MIPDETAAWFQNEVERAVTLISDPEHSYKVSVSLTRTDDGGTLEVRWETAPPPTGPVREVVHKRLSDRWREQIAREAAEAESKEESPDG